MFYDLDAIKLVNVLKYEQQALRRQRPEAIAAADVFLTFNGKYG